MTPGWLLAAAGSGLAAAMAMAFKAPRTWMAATCLGAGAAFAAAALCLVSGGMAWEWQAGFVLGGQPVHLRLDSLSALFLALLSLVGGGGCGVWAGILE
jgi:hydrogenase-4 component B